MSRVPQQPPPTLQAVVGANLRAYRQKLHMSQAEFSQLIGKRQQDLSTLERGIGNVQLRTLEEVAARIQCHPSIMLTEWETTLRLMADVAQVLQALLAQLPPAFDESGLISKALTRIHALAHTNVQSAVPPKSDDTAPE